MSRASRRRLSRVSFSTRSKRKRGHGGVDITGARMGVPHHKLISAGEVPGGVDSLKGLATTGNASKLGIWRWAGPLPAVAERATVQPCQKYMYLHYTIICTLLMMRESVLRYVQSSGPGQLAVVA